MNLAVAGTPLVATSGLGGGGLSRALNGCRTAAGRYDVSVDTFVFDTTQVTHPENWTRDFSRAPALAEAGHPPALAFHARQDPDSGPVTHPLDTDGSSVGLLARAGVRRLTPRECERLQGFPDDFTRIAWRGKPAEACPDGPRYQALGNSMAVPVMRWLLTRLATIDAHLCLSARLVG